MITKLMIHNHMSFPFVCSCPVQTETHSVSETDAHTLPSRVPVLKQLAAALCEHFDDGPESRVELEDAQVMEVGADGWDFA